MGHCSGCASPRWAHTVCQSRAGGSSTGGCPSAARQWAKRLGVGMMVEPIRPHHPGMGAGTCSSHRWRKSATGNVIRCHRGPRRRLRRVRAIGEGDAVPIPCHQPRVLDGTAPQVAGQIRHDARPVTIALHDPHIPPRLRRMTQAVEEVDELLRPHRLGQGQRPRAKVCRIAATIFPRKTAITTRAGQQKAVAHGHPLPRRRQPTRR